MRATIVAVLHFLFFSFSVILAVFSPLSILLLFASVLTLSYAIAYFYGRANIFMHVIMVLVVASLLVFSLVIPHSVVSLAFARDLLEFTAFAFCFVWFNCSFFRGVGLYYKHIYQSERPSIMNLLLVVLCGILCVICIVVCYLLTFMSFYISLLYILVLPLVFLVRRLEETERQTQ